MLFASIVSDCRWMLKSLWGNDFYDFICSSICDRYRLDQTPRRAKRRLNRKSLLKIICLSPFHEKYTQKCINANKSEKFSSDRLSLSFFHNQTWSDFVIPRKREKEGKYVEISENIINAFESVLSCYKKKQIRSANYITNKVAEESSVISLWCKKAISHISINTNCRHLTKKDKVLFCTNMEKLPISVEFSTLN